VAESVGGLVVGRPGVRYVRFDSPYYLRHKRTTAAEIAKGELLAHWDGGWPAPMNQPLI
jgi:hypothetical protein